MNKKYIFSTCNLEPDQEFDTFEDAYKAMYHWVNKRLDENGLSYQVLETAIWIETPNRVLYFHDANNIAHDIGLMKNGKLVENELQDVSK
jgi:hypothetical protein